MYVYNLILINKLFHKQCYCMFAQNAISLLLMGQEVSPLHHVLQQIAIAIVG